MSLTRRIALPGSSSRRRWLLLAFVLLILATVLFALTRPSPEPEAGPAPPPPADSLPQSSAPVSR